MSAARPPEGARPLRLRRGEAEHAAMVLEWIRRHNAHFDKELREYLFKEGPIKDKQD